MRSIALFCTAVLAAACGGEIEPTPIACVTEVGAISGDVVVLTPIEGGTIGNTGPCTAGARCVAFVDGGPHEGVCRDSR